MNGTAYVFAPAESAAPWRWCLTGPDDEYATGTGLETIPGRAQVEAELEGDAAALPVVLVVPGEEVLAGRVAVPTRSQRQIDAALPYLVEEFLAEDVDQMHLASGARSDDGTVPVRVLRPQRLSNWLEALSAAGLMAVSARVDHDALAGPEQGPGRLDVWIGAQRALVRSWLGAFAVERSELTSFVAALLAERNDAEALEVGLAVTEDADAEMLVAELIPLLGSEQGVEVVQHVLGPDLETSVARAMATAAQGAAGPELLTGSFRPPRRRGPGVGRWRLAAGVLLAWLILEGALDLGRLAWLEARTESLRAENLALFRDIVPDRTRSPDPRRELETLLGTREEGGASFLLLLGVVASELGELGSGIELRSVNWNDQRGDLAVDLSVPGITQVDRFKERLEADGYPVTIDSAVQEQARVRARLRVRDGGTG
ncbi:MAG: type II secretion system protein GspL [Pseudomonadales bacterium]|jgi:general secretion pathway protein L|nr:type II secretion system protein GspL [Pseudomonadales bacterium]